MSGQRRRRFRLNNKDIIGLKGMKFWGFHGVLPEEERRGQRFVLDVELGLDLQPAGRSDCLTVTVDYADVYECVRSTVEDERCLLIETLAEKVAEKIMTRFQVDRVKVRVSKPEAPVRGIFDDIFVEISRERAGRT